MTKQKAVIFTSPVATAGYSHIVEPDMGYKNSKAHDPRYNVLLLIDKDGTNSDQQDFVEFIRKQHEEAGGSPNVGCLKDGDGMKKEDGTQKEWAKGKWVIKFQSKFQPKVFDSESIQIPPNMVYAGDEIRVKFKVYASSSAVYKGASLQLAAVQLVSKKELGIGFGANETIEGGFAANADDSAADDVADFR